MYSVSYRVWRTSRAALLNQIETAHTAIGGSGPGRRYATQQINHAYVLLLAAEFQGFCRALHDECVEAILKVIPTTLSKVVETSLHLGRQLDRGNATPASIGSDCILFIGSKPCLAARARRCSRAPAPALPA